MGNKEKNFMSAVIYVHNAEKRIDEFLKTVVYVMEENFEHSEIICVNDCSNDESVEHIKKISMQAKSASISVLNMSYYHGLEMAMNAGVDLAIGDFVFEFDTTVLDFDKSEIMKVYHKSLEGFDIVSASPNRKQRLSSGVFYHVFERFTNLPHKLYTETFRILSRRVINRISSMNKTVPYRKAIYANCGLKTENIVYNIINVNKDIASSDRSEKGYRGRLAVDSLLLFTEVGYRFSITMTVLMMLMTIFMIVYSIVIYVMSTPAAGWTTTILFLSVAFFGLFGVLTIIIKYLQILLDLVFKRKRYSFESIEKLTK
jgi:glycosyltransferase involved in cell wall biosynthesis